MLVYCAFCSVFDHDLNCDRELGRTETIGNTSNPEFAHQFIVDFFFNEVQHIKVCFCFLLHVLVVMICGQTVNSLRLLSVIHWDGSLF